MGLRKQFLKINQFGLNLYIVSLSIEELIENYTISIYDSSTDEGYQRPPIPTHYRNIGKYLETEDPILPSAILAAVDKERIGVENNYINISGEIRIVDGQHRIEGFKYLQKINPQRFEELKSSQFPIIIMEIGASDEIYEINTFININSKGKKVSTDLAIRLREKIRTHKNDFYDDMDSLIENIATNISLRLNNADGSPFWLESIKTSPEETNTIISINAFNNSLKPIIKASLPHYRVTNEYETQDLTNQLLNLIKEAWYRIDRKWNDCFDHQKLTFNKTFNIQKGIGVNSLHIILAECIEEANGNFSEALDMFDTIILKSKLTSESWISGGSLSGYTSSSGYKKVAEFIKGKPLQ